MSSSRVALLAFCLTLMAGAPTRADEIKLPDMGSPSDGLLSVRTEAIIGRQVYGDLLETGSVITDPELQEYIQDIGMRLVAQADNKPGQSFTFFMVDSPVINAFALPGGYIGIHTGLLLAAENESELAGVLAHEISHVTQRHISRAVYANQRASTLSLAAMLGAILAGVAAGADGDVMAGAISVTQSMAIENQIAFTRANEYEADRVAVEVMAGASFDPMGMPDFFETLSRRTSTLAREIPTFLRTHPVSSDRMAETRARARSIV
ncbi:MAG: M48 family metalloprotease, partial [Gammaproteobacteria bacterium]|nr:M48 family metalloprotease [Gammaproteobacteria bacterium]